MAAKKSLPMYQIIKSFQLRLMMIAISLVIADVANAADLLDSWHAAQSKDPTFSAALAGAEAGKMKHAQAKALNLPQVTATVSAGAVNAYNKISDAQFSAPGLGTAGGASFQTQTDLGADARWNVTAQQSLYNAERSATVQQLNKQAKLAHVKLSEEEQQLILRVSKAYFDVLFAEDVLVSINKQRAAVSKALEVAKGRFEEGDVAIIDTHEAQAREDALVAQALEADSNYQLAKAALSDLTDNSEQSLARMTDDVSLQALKVGQLNDWITAAQTNSPYLHMQQIQQDIAHDEINKFQSSNSPVLNLIAQASGEELRGLGNSNNADLRNHNLSVGVQLTIPIFTGGMRNAKYEEALALEQQAKSETEVARIKASQQARAAWLGLTVGKSKVKAIEQALLSSKVKLDATELGKEAGDRTILDVLNAEQSYYETRTELYRVQYQTLLSYLNLAAVAGSLDEKYLADVNYFLTQK